MAVKRLRELYVELSNNCPLECLHCSSLASPQGDMFIDYHEMQKMLIEAKRLGAEKLILSGGEPFLYPKIWELLPYAQELGFQTKLYSSGVLMNDYGRMCAVDPLDLRKASVFVERLIFSLHGAVSELHDCISGKHGSFDLLLQTIQSAVNHEIYCELHVVPMSKNYKQIPSMIRLAERLGIKQVSLLRLVPQGRCLEHASELLLENDPEQVEEFIEIVNNLQSPTLSVRKGAPFRCLFFEQSGQCSAGLDKLLIGPDGSVHPCEAFKSDHLNSNIKNSSLRDIWETDQRLHEIRSLTVEEVEPCKLCHNLPNCHGGCPGQRWLAHGSIGKGPDPLAHAAWFA